jgi:DNA-directed RNA polymerase specialized sigma24 family protein
MDNPRLAVIQELYEQHRQGLFAYALSLTGNRVAAEDAVHTAIQRLVRRPWLPRHLKPYAFRCVRNVSVKPGASGGACGGWLQSPHEFTTTSNHIC